VRLQQNAAAVHAKKAFVGALIALKHDGRRDAEVDPSGSRRFLAVARGLAAHVAA
jgi:hypothetical protein